MTRRSGAAAIACALGLLALLGWAAWSTPAYHAPPRGPMLSVVKQEQTTAARAAAPASFTLALGGLPPEELPRLRDHIGEFADAAMVLRTPELFDLAVLDTDAATPDPLEKVLPDLPALTAAMNLGGSPWEAPGVTALLGATCAPSAARCVPLLDPAAEPADALVRRGRTLAWAPANAALVRVAASVRPALLRSLRNRQLRPGATIALVYDAQAGEIDETSLESLHHQARRALAQLPSGAPQRPWLEALAATPAGWSLPIPLRPDEVLVVPRLSALARAQDFAVDVERAGTFEWVARPGGAPLAPRGGPP